MSKKHHAVNKTRYSFKNKKSPRKNNVLSDLADFIGDIIFRISK